MSPFPITPSSMLSQAEEAIIDRTFAITKGVPNDEKWIAGIVLLADVLLRKDEFTQQRLLAGLTSELRAALHGITKIMHEGRAPNAPERLQGWLGTTACLGLEGALVGRGGCSFVVRCLLPAASHFHVFMSTSMQKTGRCMSAMLPTLECARPTTNVALPGFLRSSR